MKKSPTFLPKDLLEGIVKGLFHEVGKPYTLHSLHPIHLHSTTTGNSNPFAKKRLREVERIHSEFLKLGICMYKWII